MLSDDKINFIIDFDSTFIKVEAFDELCKLCYIDKLERSLVREKIKEITDLGMNGQLSITDSLEQRILLLQAHKNHLNPLVAILRRKVSESFERNKDFLFANADKIYIVSNGFREFILPIVKEYGISSERVHANTFEYDVDGTISGFDKNNVLAGPKGKVALVSQLQLTGPIIIIGDGYTDYEIREAGEASYFYAFIENVRRQNVVSKADRVVDSLDTIIADWNNSSAAVLTTNHLKK